MVHRRTAIAPRIRAMRNCPGQMRDTFMWLCDRWRVSNAIIRGGRHESASGRFGARCCFGSAGCFGLACLGAAALGRQSGEARRVQDRPARRWTCRTSRRPARRRRRSRGRSRSIKLPRGFKIGLYAIVPDARHMAVGPQGVVTFVGTRKSKVWAVTDRDKDRVADEVKEFAPSIDVQDPERRVLLARTASCSSPSRTAC